MSKRGTRDLSYKRLENISEILDLKPGHKIEVTGISAKELALKLGLNE